MTSWQEWFMGLARYVATASKDPSTQVGAVITEPNRIIRGMGYNGFPRGVIDTRDRLTDREKKYKYVVHAEANALCNSRGDVEGCTMYCTLHPCAACAGLIIQAGIQTVYCTPHNERWAEDATVAKTMFEEAGVDLVVINE
jgi:dCMP deaminase